MPPRRAPLIKRNIKKPKKTRTEVYYTNLKFMGEEPVYGQAQLTSGDYIRALNWYNYMCGKAEAREYIEDYLKHFDMNTALKNLKKVPDQFLPMTSAWSFRIKLQGGYLPDDVETRSLDRLKLVLDRDYKKVITEEDPDNPEVIKEVKPTVQDRIKDKASDVIAGVEELVDQGDMGISIYEHLKGTGVPSMYGTKVAEFYRRIANELGQALVDKGVAEGYSGFTKKQLKERAAFFQRIVDEAELFSQNEKKLRAPRAKKPVTVEKKLKSFKYQKEDTQRKLASIDPAKVIGASELWVFNTKYNQLTFFSAKDTDGLGVKGTSIINFNEDLSITRATGRKSQIYLDTVLKGSKVARKKLMDSIKSAPKRLQERMNDNTILLRVS